MNLNYKSNWRTYKKIREQCDGIIRVSSERDRMIWGLYARVDSLASESMAILNQGRGASCPLLIRAMLESYVDMKCLIDDPDHVFDIQARYVSKEIKHLKNYSEDNVFYLNESQKEVDDRLHDLKVKLGGWTPLSIHDRFKKIGELEIYHTVYHSLSEDSHPSLRVIAKFYDGERYTLFQQPHVAEYNFYFTSTINSVCVALADMLDYKDAGKSQVVELRENVKRVTEKGKEISRKIKESSEQTGSRN